MSTYANVSFHVVRSGDFTPGWQRESHVSRRHIPHGNRDDVQYGGKGNFRWNGPIYLDSEEDYATLETASGDAVGRTLSNFLGETKSNVRLNSVTKVERLVKGGLIRCDVEFEYSA